MQFVGPGLRDHVDNGARAAPVLGRVVVLQHAEFGDRIQIEVAELTTAEFVVGGIRAVQVTRAGSSTVAVTCRVAIEADRTVGLDLLSGLHQHQVRNVASVERKIRDLAPLDETAEFPIGGVDGRRNRSDVHGVATPMSLIVKFTSRRCATSSFTSNDLTLETGGFRRNRVRAHGQAWKRIIARRGRGCFTTETGVFFNRGNFRPGNHCLARIVHDPDDVAHCLPVDGRHGDREKRRRQNRMQL